MARSHSQAANEGVAIDRRRKVAALRLRGLSAREIQRHMDDKGFRNPDTSKAWSLAQVGRDIKALKDDWIGEARQDTRDHIAKMLAEVAEYKLKAWSDQKLELLPRAWDREAKLLGLDAAKKIDLNASVSVSNQYDWTRLNDQERAQLRELLTKAYVKPVD